MKQENMDSNDLKNDLTWSSARYSTLLRCEKKYYFQHIGGWGGWDKSAPDLSQETYHRKHLTAIHPEIGLLVHDRIACIFDRALTGQSPNVADEIRKAQNAFVTFIRRSVVRPLDGVTRKARKLLRDELGQPLTDQAVAALTEHIEVLLKGFFAFADVKALLEHPEDLIPQLLDPQNFAIGQELGVPARLRTDAVWVTENSVVVGDWKCGRPSPSHRDQGLTYDLYVRAILQLPPEEIVEVRFYYLGEQKVATFRFTEEERELHEWQIGEEWETIKSYSQSSTINIAPPDKFRARVTKSCSECSFQGICPDFIRHNRPQVVS